MSARQDQSTARRTYGRQVTQMSVAMAVCVVGIAFSVLATSGPGLACVASFAAALFCFGASQIICALRELMALEKSNGRVE